MSFVKTFEIDGVEMLAYLNRHTSDSEDPNVEAQIVWVVDYVEAEVTATVRLGYYDRDEAVEKFKDTGFETAEMILSTVKDAADG